MSAIKDIPINRAPISARGIKFLKRDFPNIKTLEDLFNTNPGKLTHVHMLGPQDYWRLQDFFKDIFGLKWGIELKKVDCSKCGGTGKVEIWPNDSDEEQ